eukprot:4281477-Pyramimonas_sp.AAC.3
MVMTKDTTAMMKQEMMSCPFRQGSISDTLRAGFKLVAMTVVSMQEMSMPAESRRGYSMGTIICSLPKEVTEESTRAALYIAGETR